MMQGVAHQVCLLLLLGMARGTRVTVRLQEERSSKKPSVPEPMVEVNLNCSTRYSIHRSGSLRSGPTECSNVSHYIFDSTSAHKSQQVDVDGCKNPLFVWKSALCGAGLFTQPQRSCGFLPTKNIAGIRDLHLVPKSDRAFGVEFEFVARGGKTWEYWSQLEGDQKKQELQAGVEGVRQCAESTNASAAASVSCSDDSDCSVYDWCSYYGKCISRRHCDGRKCPPAMDWNFITDASVKPLTEEQARQAGAPDLSSEIEGTPFELVSPPISGQSGWQSTTEALGLLRHLGVQAGPSSGLHVHVNVVGNASGAKLSTRGITNIWAAYAKYQNVINDMLSPGRQDNAYSKSLYLGDCHVTEGPPVKNKTTWNKTTIKQFYSSYPYKFNKRLFRKMFEYRANLGKFSPKDHTKAQEMCNQLLRVGGDYPEPCKRRYPWQRYYQVNLIPLFKYGTVEFRGHSATYDQERIARWIQFLIAFVEHYGSPKGAAEMNQYFSGGKWQRGFLRLAEDQQTATAEAMWDNLGEGVDRRSKRFFMGRTWEHGNSICERTLHNDPPRKQNLNSQCCLSELFK
mmetsp:Transcript_85148/g.150626  ORF Transcript_85148/g.150626 Transcript_85148/m.150626 type:complete len:569 (+) Transcript_85148:115-1821(+)